MWRLLEISGKLDNYWFDMAQETLEIWGQGVREARWRLLLLLVLVAALLYGCAQNVSSNPNTSAQSAAAEQSPEDVIREYFLALGRHDNVTREALMSTYLREARRTFTDTVSDVLFDMSGLRVAPTQPESDLSSRPERYRGYFAVRSRMV
jgi:hypothetical protein